MFVEKEPSVKGGGSVLTAKQERFVQGLVSGLSQRRAFIEAGYSVEGKSDNYIDKEASNLLKNRKVSVRYQELMGEHKDKALWTREEAVKELKWLYKQAIKSIKEQDEGYVRQGTSSALLGAIQELNKLEDLYPSERHQLEHIGEVSFIDDIN